MEIRTVGVLGCGLMGSGIAQVAAGAGYKTIVREVNDTALQAGLGRIKKFLADGVAKGKVTEDAQNKTLDNLTGTTNTADLKECDIVIEAIVENLDEKRAIYHAVEASVRPDAIIVSNTSSLCITELAAATRRPDRFGGLHFFNPVPLMKLVEVIRALTTSEETNQTLTTFATSLGKEPIAAPDRPGFIVNRLLVPYLLDAIRAYEAGVGSIEDIDTGMMAGASHPMGPLTLADFVGLDTLASIARIMHRAYGEDRFAAPETLTKLVAAGKVGRKSGEGFYDYSGDRPVPSNL